MSEDIRIWKIEDSSKAARPLEPANRMETEQDLEELLVASPGMLMPSLALIGRQTPIDGGALDLLGVDEDGRLVVFELKREKLTREAVAQVLDYCSHLDSLSEAELSSYVVEHSGKNGIDVIRSFESWYGDRHGGQFVSLRPTRMVLVGLGADSRARRMVEYLAEKGVDITLLTFHGYRCADSMLLARQVERGSQAHTVDPQPSQSPAQRRHVLAERAAEFGIDALWRKALAALSVTSDGHPTKSGITFYLPKITLPDNVNVSGSHSLTIDRSGALRVTFYPGAVDLCLEKFEVAGETIPFEREPPPNAPATKRVAEQWYCRLDETTWEQCGNGLAALVNDVHAAWQEEVRRIRAAM